MGQLNEMTEVKVIRERIDWIDFIKGMAILAVVIDHYSGSVSSLSWASMSYYSVTLFTFIAGITSYYSLKRQETIEIKYVVRRLKHILIPYIVATCLYVFYSNHFLDIGTLLKSIVGFSASAPFYFILYFLQLLIISPLLFYIISVKSKKYPFYLLVVTIAIGLFSILLVKYTNVLPLHGGGKYIFGGTYLLVFFLGMIFTTIIGVKPDKTRNKVLFGVSTLLLLIFGALYYYSVKGFSGIPIKMINPPGIILILYSLAAFLWLWMGFRLCEMTLPAKAMNIFKPINICGKYSMDIFLYHVLVIILFNRYLTVWFPALQQLKIICAILALSIPVVFRITYEKLKASQSEKKPIIIACMFLLVLSILNANILIKDINNGLVIIKTKQFERMDYSTRNAVITADNVIADQIDNVNVWGNKLEISKNEYYYFTLKTDATVADAKLFYVDLYSEGYDQPEQDKSITLDKKDGKYSGVIYTGLDVPCKTAEFRLVIIPNKSIEVHNLAIYRCEIKK